jgi:asparagine synthase (glutamine-hydrolysing)
MFAVALWDSDAKTLLLARDHLGIKPLLYLATPSGVLFSSEAKSFLELPPEVWTPAFDDTALEHLLTFQFLTDPAMCLLRGVRKVRPGHVITIRHGFLSEDAYWTLRHHESTGTLTYDQAVRECETRLLRSVELQMHADVPVGILLSGGLDSSLVAALAARRSSLPVHTFTAGFEHRWDERPHAAEVARHIGANHTEIMIDPRAISDRIEELIYYFDDLSSLDGGLFTTILMTEQIVQRGVKVLLVGEGADEAFAGYSWYGLSCLPYRLLPARIRADLFSYTLSRLLPSSRSRQRTTDRVYRILTESGDTDICRQIHRFDLLHELPSHFLMKVDHGTMANSIEARVPYLDTDLVEFAYSLPREHKFEGAWFRFNAVQEKRILRAVAARYLPDSIRSRKKRGFSIPVPEMLLSNMDKVRTHLLDAGSLARSLYTASQIERLLAFRPSFYSPLEKDKEFMVWKLFLLEVWRRHYLCARRAARPPTGSA